jgi:hypothetical protein
LIHIDDDDDDDYDDDDDEALARVRTPLLNYQLAVSTFTLDWRLPILLLLLTPMTTTATVGKVVFNFCDVIGFLR